MTCVNLIMSWTTAILHLFSQETDLLKKVIMKCVNIKLWDILGCFHYILNAPRTVRLLVKKSIPDWHLFITQMEMKWTKWYAMTLHVNAYRSTVLLFGTHTFNFNCLFDDFNCIFTQIRCLSRLLLRLIDFSQFPI